MSQKWDDSVLCARKAGEGGTNVCHKLQLLQEQFVKENIQKELGLPNAENLIATFLLFTGISFGYCLA